MNTLEWEHLVRDVMPRVRAARMLDQAETASVPHMTKEAREGMVKAWTVAAVTQVRTAKQGVVDQLASFRSWLRSHGIDPETGADHMVKG